MRDQILAIAAVVLVFGFLTSASARASEIKPFKCTIQGVGAKQKLEIVDVNEKPDVYRSVSVGNAGHDYEIGLSNNVTHPKKPVEDSQSSQLPAGSVVHYEITKKATFIREVVAAGVIPSGGYAWVMGVASIKCDATP